MAINPRLAGLLILIMLSGCSRESSDFRALRLESKHEDVARPLAESLRESEKGVKLALEDMDVFGGRTRGWSSWILRTTPLAEVAERGMREIVVSPRASLPRRLEANWVLWMRTQQDQYLEELFMLVQHPGPLAVGYARGQLVRAFQDEEIQARLNVPASRELDISLEEFRDLLDSVQPVPAEIMTAADPNEEGD